MIRGLTQRRRKFVIPPAPANAGGASRNPDTAPGLDPDACLEGDAEKVQGAGSAAGARSRRQETP